MAGASLLRGRGLLLLLGFLWLVAALWPTGRGAAHGQADPHRPAGPVAFQTGAECMACHNGLITPAGEDVSIGVSWRASMMAHSSRDPYWQGAVRREAIDHPEHAAAIEDECSICHMPMTTYPARVAGGFGKVFAHLPPSAPAGRIRWRATACRAPSAIRSPRTDSERPRASQAATSSTSPVLPARSRCSGRSRSMRAARTSCGLRPG